MSLISEAITHHQAGELDTAEQLYRQILSNDPDHPDALHLLGLINYARQEFTTAISLLQQAIKQAPANSVYSFNLGNILRDQGDLHAARDAYANAQSIEPDNAEYCYVLADILDITAEPDKAIAFYQKAIELEPDNIEAHLDLGACYQNRNQLDAAVKQYQAALTIDPTLAAAHNNLGGIYQALGNLDQAATYYRQAIAIDPDMAEAHRNYAAVLEIQGDTESALLHYREAIRINPEYNEVAFKLAALGEDSAPTVAPAEYIAGLFDQYADEFDEHLTDTLGYRTPKLLRNMYDDVSGSPGLRILDLGCGTGLSGESFQDIAEHMVGADLSPKMIEKASERKIYNELLCGDVVTALRSYTSQWDLLLAADVLVYLGDLDEFMQASSNALSSDGWLLFSVEKSIEDKISLGKSGRYAHSLDYLQDLSEQYNLDLIKSAETVLRQDYGNDIAGYLVVMKKP